MTVVTADLLPSTHGMFLEADGQAQSKRKARWDVN